MQYMICEAQYGGRITDDYDRILFNSIGKNWLAPDTLEPGFEFCRTGGEFKYIVPKAENIDAYREFIKLMPASDSPEIFGLNTNADLTFGSSEALYIIETVNETQPKETGGGGGGLTREQQVWDICDQLVKRMDDKELGYKDEDVREQIRKRPKAEVEYVLGYKPESKVDGFSIPLNVTLYQEIVRLNYVINTVRGTFNGLKQAIDGEIIMTNQLQASLDAIFDAKPPKHWYIDPSGAQYAWTLPSLALWMEGLFDREVQLTTWINTTRPTVYWMTGMFNPQGFLTAARQEVTRRHAQEKWALDDVVLVTYFTDWFDNKRIKSPPEEGIYISGLYVEGAAWNKTNKTLCEAVPKEMYCPMPVIHVSAVTSEQEKKIFSKGEFYECPVYTVPKRNGLAYIFTTKLPSEVPQRHWCLRGVALLCSKD